MEIVTDKASKTPAPELTKRIIERAFHRGLLLIAPIGMFGNVIRIAPPLVISEELADEGVRILSEVITELDNRAH
ncbi:MAG TPA: aminotransferase class III-fold pyridoxal phosphate-dependent enzyme [Armatimonadetes bacterium]|nr:aminotransferase class III-fold pyridoxal phosphate-dependent enzyme [Armatimonadota bacterium]